MLNGEIPFLLQLILVGTKGWFITVVISHDNITTMKLYSRVLSAL